MNKLIFFYFMLSLVLISPLRASQLTVVTSTKAIIYADRQLSTPIGYLQSGKRVRVGEGLQRGGKILPILITGKVAYIKVEDLALREKYQGISNGKHKVEHNTESQFSTPENELSKNIFLIGAYSSLSTKQVSTQTGSGIRTNSNNEVRNDSDDNHTNLREFSLYVEHRQPYGRFSWGIGLGFLQSTKTGETLNGLLVRGSIKVSLFQTRFITIQTGVEPFFSGDVDLGTVESTTPDTPNEKLVGLLYGVRLALQATLFPLSKYGAIIGVGLEKSYISQVSGTDQISGYSLNLTSNIIYAGLSYKF